MKKKFRNDILLYAGIVLTLFLLSMTMGLNAKENHQSTSMNSFNLDASAKSVSSEMN